MLDFGRSGMASYKIGQVAELLGVSVDSVRRLADSGRLTTIRTSGGQRVVDGRQLARFMAAVPADVKPETTVGRSARNHFPGIVTRVVKDRVMAQVEIQAGSHRLVSLISREAADELGLAPGVRAVAVVKATNVIVELPTG
jgi:molybdopterin-binding protein